MTIATFFDQIVDLKKSYYKYKHFLPERLVRSNQYFYMRRLLAAYDNGSLSDGFLKNKLKEQLLYCLKKVPFYINNVNVTIEEAEGARVEDLLERFPYIDKHIVMGNSNEFISLDYTGKRLFKRASSGSTGTGVEIQFDRQFFDVEHALFDHEWGKLGYNTKTSRHLRFGLNVLRKADEFPCERTGRMLACSPYHFNNRWLPIIVQEAEKHQPEVLSGYPSLIYEYLSYLKDHGQSLPESLKSCFLTSESVLGHQISLVKEFFGPCFSINYGLTERNIIAFSEQTPDGKVIYKLNPVYGFYENYNTGSSNYELVGTSLWNRAMPLIRYRTKDYGKIDNGYIREINGREQEFLITKEGGLLPGMSMAQYNKIWEEVKDIQLVQNEPGKLIINMVPKNSSIDFTSQTVDGFVRFQKEKWSCFFDIDFNIVKEIERTRSGKKRMVVNT